MRLDIESLALRYLVSLMLRFAGYLLMLRLWTSALVRKLRDAGQPACHLCHPAVGVILAAALRAIFLARSMR